MIHAHHQRGALKKHLNILTLVSLTWMVDLKKKKKKKPLHLRGNIPPATTHTRSPPLLHLIDSSVFTHRHHCFDLLIHEKNK